MLLDLATGAIEGDTDLAGPRQENLVEQVRRLVARRGDDTKVEAVDGPASMAGGSMLPNHGALVRGPSWEEWLERS